MGGIERERARIARVILIHALATLVWIAKELATMIVFM